MIEINNKTRSIIDVKAVRRLAVIFLQEFHCPKTCLSIAFVGDRVMRRLNKQYRGHDYTTDILSFPDPDGLGEIIINYAQIKRQASHLGHSPRREMLFMLVHGLLHLQGWQDDTGAKKEKMIRLGEDFLKKHKIYE